MSLNASQTEARKLITDFIAADPKTIGRGFFLNGRAGTGKTFLTAELARAAVATQPVVVLAPTHKALGVLRNKLRAAGISIDEIKNAEGGPARGVVYLATHSSFLGIAPEITEDQDEELKFMKTRQGTSRHFQYTGGYVIFMDESSMLSKGAWNLLREQSISDNSKVVFIGDTGQLPPVKAKPAPLEKMRNRYELTEIVRQAEGSEIVTLAGEIREGVEIQWTGRSAGDVHVWDSRSETKKFQAAFLDTLVRPTREVLDEHMSVYVAYRNRVVDAMNELACQHVYGHGAELFEAGERVISKGGIDIWDPVSRRVVSLAHTSEPLEVIDFTAERYTVYCTETNSKFDAHKITLKGFGEGRAATAEFRAYYLPEAEYSADNHPYTVELRARLKEANDWQKKFNEAKKEGNWDESNRINPYRKEAWKMYFTWRDRTLVFITHPFAITSHKSQGSTYRQAWVDRADIVSSPGGAKEKSLYVAVTRASEKVEILV